MVGFMVHLSHFSEKMGVAVHVGKNCSPESKSLNFLQFLHPSKALGYRETARTLRAVGRECVWKRINAVENGEQVPMISSLIS